MSDVNIISLTGRLTKDCKTEYVGNNNTCVVNFSLANGYYNFNKKENDVNYFDCIMWGSRGEAVSKYLSKGQLISISGELRQERWQDKNGYNQYRIRIIVNNLVLCGGKKDNNQQENNTNYNDYNTNDNYSYSSNDDDEVPF